MNVKNKQKTRNIVSFDIDGVLNNYPHCWVKYLNKITGKDFNSKAEAKAALSIDDYDTIKNEYRLSGEVSEFTRVNLEMVELIREYHQRGYRIIISTSRPILSAQYPDLFHLTSSWLHYIGLPDFELLYKSVGLPDHIDIMSQILFHVDDETKFIEEFNNFNIKTFHYSFSNCDKIPFELKHHLD